MNNIVRHARQLAALYNQTICRRAYMEIHRQCEPFIKEVVKIRSRATVSFTLVDGVLVESLDEGSQRLIQRLEESIQHIKKKVLSDHGLCD